MRNALKVGWETNSNFFQKGARHIGFQDISNVFELIDNSIDAESTQVDITFSKNTDGTKNIIVSDNGNGFEYGTLLPCVRTWGSTRDYDNTQIGNFGVGMSATFNEVVQDGGSVKITTSDGTGHKEILTIEMSDSGEVGFFFYKEVSLDNSSFTIIELSGVKTKLTTDDIIKLARVTYYPNFDRNPDFVMTIKNGKGGRKKIDFVDPFYRDISDCDAGDGSPLIKTFIHTFNFDGHDIDILVKGFYPGFDTTHLKPITDRKWDKSKQKDYHWVPISNSGLYLRYGGRYINTGNRLMPGTNHGGSNYTGLRFEIEIPKHVQNFPINVNKSKVSFDDKDSRLDDLFRVVKQLRAQYKKFFDKSRGRSSHSKEFIDFINKFVSKMIEGSAIKNLINAFPNIEGKQTRVTHDPPLKPGTVCVKDTNLKRPGKNSGTGLVVDIVKGAKSDPFYSWDNVPGDGVVTITYNENSEMYQLFVKEGGKQSIGNLALLHYFELYSMKNISDEKADTDAQKESVQDFEDIVDEVTRLSNKQFRL